MRKLTLLIVFATGAIISYSQKVSYGLKLGTGLFAFSGNGAVKETGYTESPTFEGHPPPYGKKPRFSYTIEATVKKVTRNKIIFGGGLGFQSLSTRTEIVGISMDILSSSILTPDWGYSDYRANCISVSPFIGRRLSTGKKSALDIMVGPELGILANEELDIEYKLRNAAISDKSKAYPDSRNVDVRLQATIEWQVGRIGLFTGYTRGLSNLYQYYRDQQQAYSNFARAGVSFRF